MAQLYDELSDSSFDEPDDGTIPMRPPSAKTPIISDGKGQHYQATDPSTHQQLNMNKLSLITKLCFAVGGVPYQMCSNAIGLYISPFLLEIAGLRPTQISIILFSARGWDAITDPLVGFFVSKTNTRFGKLRPWILFAAPLSVACYMMIWYVPDISRSLKTFWYLFFYCLFQTFLSCLHVPYTSLTMYLTPNQAERDVATGFRMIFEILGVLLAAGIQGAMITIYGSIFSCDDESTTTVTLPDTFTTGSLNYTTTTTTKAPGYSKLGEGYLVSAGVMSFIYILCCCATFFGTKEMHDVIEDKDKKFVTAIKSVFTHKSYITLLLAFLFNSLAVQVIQTNIALYCKYSIDAKDSYQIIIIVLLVASIVSLPVWHILMFKFGKKTTYAGGLILLLPCLFALLYLTKPVWVMYVIAVVAGFTIAINFLLPWSMLPDVIDEFMIKTGTRRESIFYSFYVFFTKLSSGIAVGVSTAFLDVGGYIDCPNGCCVQPESVGRTVRLLMVPGPVIMILLALIFIWLHPIDEVRRKEIKNTLVTLRERHNSVITEN